MTDRRSADEYRVAIPSYRRAAVLAERTLPFLFETDVEPGRITVFVHSHDEQLDRYVQLAEETGVSMITTTARGVAEQRQHVLRAYPNGTPLVQIDDDVVAVKQLTGPNTLAAVRDMDSFIRSMFAQTASRDLWVWGLAPVANAFFMRDQLSEKLKFLIFALLGMYTRPDHPVHQSTVPVKEDYELSLRAWWYDGGVLRNDGAAAVHDTYRTPGGCQSTRTAAQEQESVDALIAQWPGLVRLNTRRKSEFPQILLSSRKRHTGHPADVPPPGYVKIPI